MAIECWKCPKNTIELCKKEEKYCKRYFTKSSILPNTQLEVHRIREKERLFWENQKAQSLK